MDEESTTVDRARLYAAYELIRAVGRVQQQVPLGRVTFEVADDAAGGCFTVDFTTESGDDVLVRG